MKHFRPHAEGFTEIRRAKRHDHEFLKIDVIVGVLAAVEDVHHGHGQVPGIGAAQVAVKRQPHRLCRRVGDRKRDAQNCVRT